MDQRLRYLETRINSASPGELLVMLFDGLINHAERARTLLSEPATLETRRQAADSVTRCIDILTELNVSLNHRIMPELCAQLSDLYLFYTRELSAALEKTEPGRIEAIMPLILSLRQTWKEADGLAGRAQIVAA